MADLRLAELLVPLSQVTDLGMGRPPGAATRTCVLATALARSMGLAEPDVATIWHTALLQHIGCTAYAHETAAVIDGDDIAFRAAGATVDDANLRESLAFLLTGVARDASPFRRARAVLGMLRAGSAFGEHLYRANCEVAIRTVDRLGLPGSVQESLGAIYARWDGKGSPPALAGEELPLATRVTHVAAQAALFHELGGPDLAIATVERRAGGALDPAIAADFIGHADDLLAEVDAADPFVTAIAAEPEPRHRIATEGIDAVARALADITDLKSPWLHGHSAGVATLAAAAATEIGLPAEDIDRIRRAGYLHDLGRVGVPSGIWDKPGPLTTAEWEQVRLHAYHSERILSRSPALADLAPMVGMHHERLDGSGYHRGASGSAIPTGARILAAADAWDAMTHARPHRPALDPEAAAAELRADADIGRLDPDAARAVLAAAGQAVTPARREWPAGLTDREVEVLRLAARGRSTREIGATLYISPKTADHHIQHIYAKIGVSTRAGAALFAMEHDLLDSRPAGEMG
jgi:HD-GYP domain-containing protein (c-di-GMP phosphodiesterase class II)